MLHSATRTTPRPKPTSPCQPHGRVDAGAGPNGPASRSRVSTSSFLCVRAMSRSVSAVSRSWRWWASCARTHSTWRDAGTHISRAPIASCPIQAPTHNLNVARLHKLDLFVQRCVAGKGFLNVVQCLLNGLVWRWGQGARGRGGGHIARGEHSSQSGRCVDAAANLAVAGPLALRARAPRAH